MDILLLADSVTNIFQNNNFSYLDLSFCVSKIKEKSSHCLNMSKRFTVFSHIAMRGKTSRYKFLCKKPSFARLRCVINSLPPNYRDLKLLKFVFFCFFLTLSTCRWLITWQLCSVLGFSSDIHKSPFSGLAEETSPIWNYSHG